MSDTDRFRIYTAGNPAGAANFYAGRVPDGRGLLAGPSMDGLLLVWFEPSGRLLGTEVAPLPSSQPDGPGGKPASDADWTADALAWLAAAGFRAEPIEVDEFWADEPVPDDQISYRGALTVGVARYPWHLEPVMPNRHPDLSDPELRDLADELRNWDSKGMFVVHWGSADYYLSVRGGYSS